MGLLLALKRNPDIRRLFGKRELLIIEKQLSGVNLKQSEKTRLSRDIRKKFEAIQGLSTFVSEFKLKKGAEIKALIEETKEVILKSKYFTRIKKVVLFGSTVENKRTFRSDIDIAVEFDLINSKEALQFKIDASKKLNSIIDIRVYNLLHEKIKNEVDVKGKILYEREN